MFPGQDVVFDCASSVLLLSFHYPPKIRFVQICVQLYLPFNVSAGANVIIVLYACMMPLV